VANLGRRERLGCQDFQDPLVEMDFRESEDCQEYQDLKVIQEKMGSKEK